MVISNLVKEADEVFFGPTWYGEAVIPTLKAITFNNTNLKIHNSANSIAQLVKHMQSWKTFIIEKLNGNGAFDIPLNSPLDWDQSLFLHHEKEWNQLLELLEKTHKEMTEKLTSKEQEWLKKTYSGKKYSNENLIRGIIHHDVYHIGQIRLINKFAGIAK